MSIEGEELLQMTISAALEIKPETLTILDLRGISSFTERFLILGAPSQRQVHALADRIEERLKANKVQLHHREGYNEAKWVLLDYGDLVVHIFDKETKDYYDLERLWRDAPQIRMIPSDVQPSGQGAT